MNLVAESDGLRIWIEDRDTDRDDPDQVLVHFRVRTAGNGDVPKRREQRFLSIARTMAEAANREHG